MDLLTILKESHSDISYGVGSGSGNGNGFGDEFDHGWGNGHGSDNGNGFSDGYGYGHGTVSVTGYGYGYGDSSTSCSGTGWSNGNSKGEGYGFNNGREITEINGMKVYMIDDIPTAVETAFGNYMKGYTISNNAVLVPCYVAMDGFSFAHGKTLKEAFRDARTKEMKKLPAEERAKRFIAEHPDPEEILPNEKIFALHHILTGSCEFGRREFCRKNDINLESSMSISEFLSLTEEEFGGNVIKKIKEEYLRRAETDVSETPIFAS